MFIHSFVLFIARGKRDGYCVSGAKVRVVRATGVNEHIHGGGRLQKPSAFANEKQ
jgi:hypothetical protein